MKGLTKQKAIEYSIKIWTQLEETGGGVKDKQNIARQYAHFLSDCPLCEECDFDKNGCERCVYYLEFHGCEDNGYYAWSYHDDESFRKAWAKKFLGQLHYLQNKYGEVGLDKEEEQAYIASEDAKAIADLEGKAMTKRCKHKWEQKPDYPEDIICRKCQTIKEVSSLTRQQFLKLPLELRRTLLSKQVAKMPCGLFGEEL